jgi:alpha-beta hydrolase superfamily lysophospholipase
MKNILFLILLLSTGNSSFAQNPAGFTGSWEGKLNVGIELRIIFHIKEDGKGGFMSSADSPDQSAYDLKCDATTVSGQNITIEMNSLRASYTGKLLNDSTIEGTFTQGADIALTLTRQKGTTTPTAAVPLPTTLSYKSSEVSLPLKDVTLSGTFFQPLQDDKKNALLIIAGSGPTDRDGNSPLIPGKNNSLLQLADSLVHHGIAVLRYDKRGIGKSKMATGLGEENTTFPDMTADAAALYNWIKEQGYINIYMAGHSEGSLVGMIAAGQVKARGFISIAGAGRKAGDILKEQLSTQLTPELNKQFTAAIDSLEKGFTVTKTDPSLMSLLRPSVQPYMRSWLAADPQQIIRALKMPVLILQGTKDLQIKEADAQLLAQYNKKATLSILPNINHVLKEVLSDKREENLKTYADPKLSLPAALISAITGFIHRSSK